MTREFSFTDLALYLGGTEWRGWKSVQVTRSVEAMAGAFALGLTSRLSNGGTDLPLSPGMPCTIADHGEPLITGYIDTVAFSLSGTEHAVTVQGRDKSGDLVDCSAVYAPGNWKKTTLPDILSALAAPFGVPVKVEEKSGGLVETFSIDPGETVSEAMQRLLTQRELIAMPDGLGGLRIARIGAHTMDAVLEEGRSVTVASTHFSAEQRFSDYICKGQKQGTDSTFGAACSVRGEIKDDQITRYRPFLLTSSQQGDAAHMRSRARWEMTTRRAEGTSVEVTVQGWRSPRGELWQPGALLPVELPTLHLSQSLLIAEATFSLSASGSTTRLTLKDPAAWQQEPAKPEGPASSAQSAGTSLDIYVKQAREAHAAGAQAEEAF